MKAIETFELTKYYGQTRGMVEVTLSVDEGEIFGFIGPNGAGKSTLIRTLLGLLKPTSGSAKIFGRDIEEGKIDNLREIGYLPAETSFYRGMRVKDLLKFSADMRGVDCTEEADRLCKRLDLDPERRISKLSYGNRKKVGIVCALQHKPRLAILDEPTGGLDPFMQKEFFEILKERQREGATVFLSSHVLSEIKRYCDRAAIIREGRILLLDSVANLAHTGVKRVSVRGLSVLPMLDGISGVKTEQDQTSFLYSKDVRELLSALADSDVTDVNISDPELDEVLMAYYEKEATV